MPQGDQPDTGGGAEALAQDKGAAQGVNLAQYPILQHVPFPDKLDFSNEATHSEV